MLYIFSLCCLIVLFFSLSLSEIYLCWVSCFYFCKITVFITGNAPVILKIFNNKTHICFFLDDYNKRHIVFGGDFKLIFDCKFHASEVTPILKKNL